MTFTWDKFGWMLIGALVGMGLEWLFFCKLFKGQDALQFAWDEAMRELVLRLEQAKEQRDEADRQVVKLLRMGGHKDACLPDYKECP